MSSPRCTTRCGVDSGESEHTPASDSRWRVQVGDQTWVNRARLWRPKCVPSSLLIPVLILDLYARFVLAGKQVTLWCRQGIVPLCLLHLSWVFLTRTNVRSRDIDRGQIDLASAGRTWLSTRAEGSPRPLSSSRHQVSPLLVVNY